MDTSALLIAAATVFLAAFTGWLAYATAQAVKLQIELDKAHIRWGVVMSQVFQNGTCHLRNSTAYAAEVWVRQAELAGSFVEGYRSGSNPRAVDDVYMLIHSNKVQELVIRIAGEAPKWNGELLTPMTERALTESAMYGYDWNQVSHVLVGTLLEFEFVGSPKTPRSTFLVVHRFTMKPDHREPHATWHLVVCREVSTLTDKGN